jgi:hypothetical protein
MRHARQERLPGGRSPLALQAAGFALIVVIVLAGGATTLRGASEPTDPESPATGPEASEPAPPGTLDAPRDVQATYFRDEGASEVRLQWGSVPGASHYRIEQNGEVSDLLDAPAVTVNVAGGRTYRYRVRAVGSSLQNTVSDWSAPVALEVPPAPPYSAERLATDFEDPADLDEWGLYRMVLERGRLAAPTDSATGSAHSARFDFVDQSVLTIEFGALGDEGDDQWIALDLEPGAGLQAERFYAHLARLDFGPELRKWAVEVTKGGKTVIEYFETDTSRPAWGRIWRDGESLAFQVSTDEAAWQTLTTVPLSKEPRGVKAVIIGGNWERNIRPWHRRKLYFDNLNLPPPALAPTGTS